LTQGPKVLEFETKFAEYVGFNLCCGRVNGTAALHLSDWALGVNEKSKIITTSDHLLAASANCIRYCGGESGIFADIDPETALIESRKWAHT